MKNDIIYIYALVDPRTEEIRYVGRTKNLRERYGCHTTSKWRRTKKSSWIIGLKQVGLLPKLIVLEETNNDEWANAERWWISYLRSQGDDLTNLDCGGIGGSRVSQETREKMSRAHKGKSRPRERSPEEREARSISREKLTSSQAAEIRTLLATRHDLSLQEIAKMYDVSGTTVNAIRHGEAYSRYTCNDGLQDAIDSRKRRRFAKAIRDADWVTDDMILKLRELADGGMGPVEASRITGVDYNVAWNIINYKSYVYVK